jgi:membrane fusion protein, multidrug efflux system
MEVTISRAAFVLAVYFIALPSTLTAQESRSAYSQGTATAAPTPSYGGEIRAQLSPKRYATLVSEIGAKIERLPVQEGASFNQGDELIAFDCAMQKAQLEKAKAVLAATKKTYTSNQRLSELNSVGQLELELSESEVQKAQAELEISTAIVSKCNISAPYSGRMSDHKVREQEYVEPGQAMLEIIDDTVLEIEFIAPSRLLSWVKPGSKFRVRIDETGRSYPAKVLRIGAKVDPVSQTVKLIGAIDGTYPELVAGMGGRVSFSAKK